MSTKKIIFAIDDEEAMLHVYRVVLDDLYELLCFSETSKLLKMVDNVKPDLVNFDIGLVEMDGYQLCEEFRLKQGMDEVPVIYVTGRDFSEDKGEAFFSGAVDYVMKPIEMDSFREIVAEHLKSTPEE